MSGTFASTIRANRFKNKLTCLQTRIKFVALIRKEKFYSNMGKFNADAKLHNVH